MLTRNCPRCEGSGKEPQTPERACIGCKGTGQIEVPEEPVKPYAPSTSDGVMVVDPPSDPEKKAARKRAMEPCGSCACCRRWKAKAHLSAQRSKMAFASAQKWAAYWKQQYASLSAAKKIDHKSVKK